MDKKTFRKLNIIENKMKINKNMFLLQIKRIQNIKI